MTNNKRNSRGFGILAQILLWCGVLLLLISIAGFLFRYQNRTSAEKKTEAILEKLSERIPQEADQAALPADLSRGSEAFGLLQISGVACSGILSIPNLRKEWPVGGIYEDLRTLPRLKKRADRPSLFVIEGMDYESQFSILRQIVPGDEVIFTDINGLTYTFETDYAGTDPGRREENWKLELQCYMGEETPFCVGCK